MRDEIDSDAARNVANAAGGWRDSLALYDCFAADYDVAFAAANHRKAYDLLAWEQVAALLPRSPGIIVDAGCGTGRWIGRLLSLGHRVIGIEQSPNMIAALLEKGFGSGFELIAQGMEAAQIPPASADLVMAIGSVQYTRDPGEMIRRFAAWTKPGGHICVMMDSLVALVVELMRLGKVEEALTRLRSGRGVFALGDTQADLFLYDSRTLRSQFAAAGLVDLACRGLLVSSSAWGSAGCSKAMASDEAAFLALERELASHPQMADCGKHLFASGRRAA